MARRLERAKSERLLHAMLVDAEGIESAPECSLTTYSAADGTKNGLFDLMQCEQHGNGTGLLEDECCRFPA